MDRKCHNVHLSQWYGNYKRNDQVNVEDKRKGIATESRRPKKKKYMSERQSTKMKVVEDHHVADGYLVEDLKRELQKRKNLLLYRIATHMENEASSDISDEDTTSEVHGMEGGQGAQHSFHHDATLVERSSKEGIRRCKSTGPDEDAPTDVGRSDAEGTVGAEGNNVDVHSSIKIMVAQALGMLKDSCARPPGMPRVPTPRRMMKKIARRGYVQNN